MKLTVEDERLLAELCEQYNISLKKVVKLLKTVREYEFKDRRRGIYDALREIIRTDFSQ